MSLEISFIIPVYNGQKTIQNSIKSIQNWNKEQEIEIVIINDGSTDDTEEICEDIAKEDIRVRLYSIANSGQGVARNYGMQQCRGTYIYFVDADDTVDAEQIFCLWEAAQREHADVVMGGYVRVNGNQRERIHLPGEGLISRNKTASETALYHKVKTESAFGYVWNKLYRRAFLEKNHLQMDDINKIYMEDQLFNLKVWSKRPVWYCCDRAVYFYETTNASTTRKAEPQIHIKNITMISELIRYLKENQNIEENLDVVIPLVMRTLCWSMVKNVEYEGKSFKKFCERADAYIKSEEVQQVIRMRGAVKALSYLPSVLQTVFYTICLLLVRIKWSGCIAFMFDLSYPIMKRYIIRVLK